MTKHAMPYLELTYKSLNTFVMREVTSTKTDKKNRLLYYYLAKIYSVLDHIINKLMNT